MYAIQRSLHLMDTQAVKDHRWPHAVKIHRPILWNPQVGTAERPRAMVVQWWQLESSFIIFWQGQKIPQRNLVHKLAKFLQLEEFTFDILAIEKDLSVSLNASLAQLFAITLLRACL